MPSVDHEGVGLYVHVPFCARACPYCDFDFEVRRVPDAVAFVAALSREIRRRGLAGRRLRTVYVGGGTPSLLGPEGLAGLLEAVAGHFDLRAVEEVTVEANPEHVDDRLISVLVRGGVTRLSLGVQSFDRGNLGQLGRCHDPDRAAAAVTAARAAGLAVSVDLIVGLPGQAPEDVAREVSAAVATGTEHVSVYALTIEEGVPWHALVRRGVRRMPDDDAQAGALRTAASCLAAAGYVRYEISNYARPGWESIHNLGYWTGRDYVGIGPSAASAHHGPCGVTRRTNPRGWAAYRDGASAFVEHLDPETAAREGLWLALRRTQSWTVEAFAARFDRGPSWLSRVLATSRARGWVEMGDGRIGLTARGALFHDALGRSIFEAPSP